MMRQQSTCEIPGCGVTTTAFRHDQLQVWLDKDFHGNPGWLQLCPQHMANWYKMVSDFLAGDGSKEDLEYPPSDIDWRWALSELVDRGVIQLNGRQICTNAACGSPVHHPHLVNSWDLS